MPDYSNLGLTPFMQHINAPVNTRPEYIDKISFKGQYEVDATYLRASKLQVKSLIKQSSESTASSSFTTGQSLLIEYIIVPDADKTATKMIPIVRTSVYEGTAADQSFQIWPRQGGSIPVGDYSMWAGYDYERSTNTAYQGGGSRWMLILNNDAAGSVDIYLEGDVLYFQDQGGESDVS